MTKIFKQDEEIYIENDVKIKMHVTKHKFNKNINCCFLETQSLHAASENTVVLS